MTVKVVRPVLFCMQSLIGNKKTDLHYANRFFYVRNNRFQISR